MLSVIITAHNVDAYIDDCLASIVNATHHDLEIIVVDDGSTDTTPDRLTEWRQRDDRIRLDTTDHFGRNAALRRAHDLATGDTHCWVDADDRVHPTAFTKALDKLDDDHQLVYTQRNLIDPHGRPAGNDTRNRIPYSPDRLLVDNMIFHLRIFTSELFAAAGGVGDLSSAIDWDMNLRMTEHTTPRHVPQRLYDYRIRPGRMTGRPDQHLNARLAVQAAITRRQLPYRLITNRTGWHIARVTP